MPGDDERYVPTTAELLEQLAKLDERDRRIHARAEAAEASCVARERRGVTPAAGIAATPTTPMTLSSQGQPGRNPLNLLDWGSLSDPTAPINWVCEPMIEAGRLVALYSPPKTGKSLLALEVACGLASGRPFWGRPEPAEQQSVLYADWENSPEDVFSRVRALAYRPHDLRRLHYASFPRLAPLVGDAARTFVTAVQDLGATLVILDTFSRIIDGNEKDAQVIQRSYRDLFMPLKAEGVAVLAARPHRQGPQGRAARVVGEERRR